MGNVIGVLSTNYTGAHYGELIADRPVASIPFGGRYRLIDFPLSPMVNSGIDTVGVITPSNYRSLADHLNMGREWGLNTKQGGMFLLPGAAHGLRVPNARFSLRDIILNKEFFERADEETVLICAANRIYNMDFRPAIAQHEASGAEVTMIYKVLSDSRTGSAMGLFLDLDENGRVTGIDDASVPTGPVNMGGAIFLDSMLISRQLILDFIDCYGNLDYVDLTDILAENLDRLQIHSWRYDGYEHAVDHAQDYLLVSQDLLRPEIQEELFPADRGRQLHSGRHGGKQHPLPERDHRRRRRGEKLRADAARGDRSRSRGGKPDLRQERVHRRRRQALRQHGQALRHPQAPGLLTGAPAQRSIVYGL